MANFQIPKIDQNYLSQLTGYRRLTTVIRYFMPDYPLIICPNPFIIQLDDKAPTFPVLKEHLDYWAKHVETTIESVTIAEAKLISPSEVRTVEHLSFLH